VPAEKTHKLQHTEKALNLFELYKKVRDTRENVVTRQNLPEIWNELITDHPEDWLCALEIMEILHHKKSDPLYKEIKVFLDLRKSENDTLKKLIEDGYLVLET
jgi:phenylalanine-4-hydroxylase